jgi:molybdopterin synthase sulfur carrier subunit
MLRVEVRVYATLRKYLGEEDQQEVLAVQLATGSTVADLIARLGIPPAEVKVVFINHCAVPQDHTLQEGDRVGVFPLVAGG